MVKTKTSKNTTLNFGSYPQTVKAENVVIDKSQIYKINSLNCFKGNDNHYYVEETVSNPNKLKINNISLSNGKKIKVGEKLYFKIEPIKWDILCDNKNRKTLLSNKVLDCYPFDNHFDGEKIIERKIKGNTVFPSFYEYSNVRAFLNSLNGESYDVYNYSGNGFIDKAFTKIEREQLKSITIDNGISSLEEAAKDILDISSYNSSSTCDKVFLSSLKEIEKLDKSNLTKYATDYAIAKGVPTVFGQNNSSCWWSRSPSWTEMYGIVKDEAACVDSMGCFEIGCHVDLFNGIVPGIYI